MRAGSTSAIATLVVREPTFSSKVTFFVARNYFINLVRKPSCISIVQGCACGGNVGVAWGLSTQLGPSTPRHEMPTVRQGLREVFLAIWHYSI